MLETESLAWITGNDSAVNFFFPLVILIYKIPFFLMFGDYMGMSHLNWVSPAFQF